MSLKRGMHEQPEGGKKARHTNLASLWEESYKEQIKDADTLGRNMCGMLALPKENQHACHTVSSGESIRGSQTGNGLGGGKSYRTLRALFLTQ